MNNNNDYMYYKLKEELLSSLESEEFYDVFNRSIRSGKTNFSQYQKLINNIIDPIWVTAIEECIIPIDNIVRNPMRFIVQEEEIVPIEQTKRVSQESIRHLAQHTSMISKVDKDGSVTPNKLLNVYKEETFATYENRFIYTLLKHLQYFIDKRLRVLNDSKIQAENKISVESEFLIGKEKINYEFSLTSVEKTEKNKKVFKLDEDTSQMDLLHRVERLRMILYDFQNSQLIKNLEGCLTVKPPIMRTNMILKNPNFKKALELWTFIESYNDAGLSIQVFENEEMPNDQYINEMFTVALINYHLFNHHVKPEKKLEQIAVREKEFKPSLIRRTVEEYVKDFTMDIDEIEKVFIDQIKKATKKRKDAEGKIKKAIERAIEKEKDNKKKTLELEKKRKEEAKLRAKQAKEQAKLLAKQAKAEEKLRIKTNIQNNIDAILQLLEEKYSELDIKFNRSRSAFRVTNTKTDIFNVQYNSKEGTINFRAAANFYDYVEEQKPGLITKEIVDEQPDWYSVTDRGDLDVKDVKAIVNHSIKYIYQLEAEEERKLLELAEKNKKIVFNKELVDEQIQEIRDYILKNYLDVEINETSDNSFRVYRNKKLVIILQWTNTNYRMVFQRKKSAVLKLMKKYPQFIAKAKNPKGHQWYKLLNTGDIKLKVVLSLIEYSYNFVIEEEIKAEEANRKKYSSKKKRKTEFEDVE